jgi:hypothetical protein
MASFKFNVYGRWMVVEETAQGWAAFYVGDEGKRRPATDIVIPESLFAAELAPYLADLCHEWATEQHPDVRRLN